MRDGADGQRPLVLGNGYGGFVALRMVLDRPDLVARLVPADSGAAFSESGRAALPDCRLTILPGCAHVPHCNTLIGFSPRAFHS